MKHYSLRICLLLALVLAGTASAWAQFTATGRVTDAAGDGLPGVTIQVVGAARGATTTSRAITAWKYRDKPARWSSRSSATKR